MSNNNLSYYSAPRPPLKKIQKEIDQRYLSLEKSKKKAAVGIGTSVGKIQAISLIKSTPSRKFFTK